MQREMEVQMIWLVEEVIGCKALRFQRQEQ